MAEYPQMRDKHLNYEEMFNKDAIKKKYTVPTPQKAVKISTFEEDVNDIAFELVQLLLQKHKDYGPKNINQSPYGATQGLVVRMWDKIARIVNLTSNKRHAENEPLEDSFKDLANYAIIGLMVQRGKWPNE
jgi:hypothetical protein